MFAINIENVVMIGWALGTPEKVRPDEEELLVWSTIYI